MVIFNRRTIGLLHAGYTTQKNTTKNPQLFSMNKKESRPAEGIHDQVAEADRKNRGSDVHLVQEYHYEVQCPEIVTFEEDIPGGLDLVLPLC